MNNLMQADTVNVKKITETKTVDQYSVVFLKYPNDFSAFLFVVCDTALLVPQIDYGSGMSFRCFGDTNALQLNSMIGKTINITFYYI